MKGEDIVSIVRSPAFTIFAATLCAAFLMKQVPVIVATFREMKETD